MTDHTTVYLVRHPETLWNAEGRCQGHADSDFTERGHAQLRELVSSLACVPFDAAYTSPLGRAHRTATALLAAARLRALRVRALAELSYGDLNGSRCADWPATLQRAWADEPCSVRFPNGESLADLCGRVVPAFHDIVAAHVGDTVLISSHGHVNRVLILDVEERPLEDFWHVEQSNATALRLAYVPTVRT
ncbi:MAG TPA: histidine phosphatase family protein [Gemmatimonadaceae bacterium]|nr:histidine phosphatase family protein [Gemmatimonadaceae bacterium]